MPRRTKEAAQATRERLLDAAEQLFLERGVGRTTLGDIAEAAGATRGAVYWHFADKTALVRALFERVDLPMEQALQAAERDAGLDPLARLRRLAREPFALMSRDRRARAVFVILLHRAEFTGELDGLNTRNDAAISDCTLRMQRLFEQAADAGQLAPGITPRAAAVALLALVDGLMRLATAAHPVVDTEGARAPRPCGADTSAAAGPDTAIDTAIDALLAGLTLAAAPGALANTALRAGTAGA